MMRLIGYIMGANISTSSLIALTDFSMRGVGTSKSFIRKQVVANIGAGLTLVPYVISLEHIHPDLC